jgi:hypothetical protein
MVAIAVSNSATAQVEVVPSTQAVFSGSVNVELINIDVFVSDRHGNPVADLGIDDFELFEDGKAVEISHFAAVGTSARTPRDGSLTDLRIEDRPAADELQEDLLPHLVIAFDSRHLTHTAKRRMMKGLREFMSDTSVPHKQVMIMHLGHDKDKSFDVVVPFGSTLEDLVEGLDRVKKAAPGGRAVEVSYRIVMNNISEAHMEFRRRANYTPGSLEADPNSVCRLVRSQWLAEIKSFSLCRWWARAGSGRGSVRLCEQDLSGHVQRDGRTVEQQDCGHETADRSRQHLSNFLQCLRSIELSPRDARISGIPVRYLHARCGGRTNSNHEPAKRPGDAGQ